MRIPALPLVPLALAAAAAGCSPAAAGDARRLTLTGSSTVAPLVLEIAKRFEAEHPGVRIDVQTGGSSRGIADARSGLADLGMASRALAPSEAADLEAFPIAHDGVGLLVHADNPVAELTDDQVRAVFRGEVARWSELGGPDAPITVVNKAAGRATLAVFLEHFGLDEREVRADVVIGDNEQGIKTVAGNPHAIGYVSIGTAASSAEAGVPVRLLPADGVEPTLANVGSGRFPIGRPLNLVARPGRGELARAFVAYCRSAAVHDLVRGLRFVPVRGGG